MNVLVVGMEKTGLASVEFLRRRRDTPLLPPTCARLPTMSAAAALLDRLNVPFAPQSSAPFTTSDLVVTSPGVPDDIAPLDDARAAGVTVFRLMSRTRCAPYLKGNTIGITGSNGKTTTTALIGHIFPIRRSARTSGRQHRHACNRHDSE